MVRDSKTLYRVAKILCLILIGLLSSPQIILASDQSRINELTRQSNELESQIKEKEAAAADKREEASALNNEIDQISNDISLTESKIESTQAEIDHKNEEITQAEADISEKEAEVAEQLRNQDETIRILYETSAQDLLFLVVGSDSISEVIEHNEYLTSLEDQIESTVAEIEQLKRELEEKKSSLEEEKKGLDTLKAQHEAYKIGLDDEKSRKDSLLSSATIAEKELESEISEAKRLNDQVEAELSSIRAKLTRSSGPGVIKAADQGTSSVGFQWPSNYRYISTYFGGSTPFQPGGGHGGLDLVNSAGTPIYAAADGTVTAVTEMTYNGNFYAYGRYIVIGHNARWSSLYAHLQSFAVSPGQEVKRGDVIGFMGSTGWSTGPHLHFEVWEYSSRVNPLSYLP